MSNTFKYIFCMTLILFLLPKDINLLQWLVFGTLVLTYIIDIIQGRAIG